MKITEQHYAHLRGAIRPILARIQVPHTARIRWDALFHAGLGEWLNAELYPYLTDAHIDTALKAISKEVREEFVATDMPSDLPEDKS